MTEQRLQIHYDGDGWAALYVNGVLDYESVGDSHLAEERALALCGVKVVEDSAFMRGQDKREGVAQTVVEVEAYRHDRGTWLAHADDLERQAADLLSEANRLRGVKEKSSDAGQPS